MKRRPLLRLRTTLSLLLMAMVGMVLAVPEAYAAGGAALDPFCDAGDGLVLRIVTCMEDIVREAAYTFIFEIFPPVEMAIYAFLTLTIIFFGVTMLMGAIEKPGRDSMIYLLKFAAVIYFTANMWEILYWFVGAPGDAGADAGALGQLVDIVTQFTLFDFATPLRCPAGEIVWARVDCMLDVIVGVNTDNSLSDGMLAFFFHNFFVGSVGVIIALLGIWMLFAFVIGMLTAIHTYIMAFILVCFLVIVGILFLPLVMFKGTYDYFQRWTRMTIANMIIPMVLFAYMNVMLSAMDIVLYSGEHSVFRVFAGDAVDGDGFNIHSYMYDNDLIEEVEDKGPIHDQRQTRFPTPAGVLPKGELFQFGEYPEAAVMPKGIGEIPIAIPMKKIDYDAAAGLVGAGSGIILMEQVFAAMIITALISYILIALLKSIPGMAEDLAGGTKETPRIATVAAGDMPLIGNSSAMSVTKMFRDRASGMVGGRR